MPARRLAADEPFFREWNLFHGPMTRSRTRASLLTDVVGIDTSPPIPVIGVVGSKGKGSCVAAITQQLVELGHTVGTICSPPFLTNHERIRINGTPVDDHAYKAIAERLSTALESLPPVSETHGYLAPTGAFTLMGAWYLMNRGVTVLVIEEGLGGATDEISQFRLDTLVVTPVFLEHEGVIGNTTEEIAHNLVGAADERTRHVVTPDTQGPEARAAIAELLPRAELWTIPVPPDLGFGPLTSMNVATGYSAAHITHAVSVGPDSPPPGLPPAPDLSLAHGLRLPGRSSTVTRDGRTWFLDAAISREGVASALASAFIDPGFTDAPLLVCMPDIKDVASILEILPKERTTLVRTHEDHLDFDYPDTWTSVTLKEALAQLTGTHAIALGTMSFAADMAAYLELDTSTWFTPAKGHE